MIAPAERNRLAAVLGMLGSDAAGERAAAGLLATRLLKATGITWRELLGVDVAPSAVRPAAEQHPSAQAERDAIKRHQREALDLCQRHPGLLSEWERAFITGISRTRRSLSMKQTVTLMHIADALRRKCRA